MAIEFPLRPKKIDRLRLVHLMRKHFGEQDAVDVADALQDEFATVVTHDDISRVLMWIDGRLNALLVRVLFGVAVIVGAIASIALAIAAFL